LDAEIADHDEIVDDLTQQAAPQLREAFGIGPDIAADMLILAGDQPRERLKSERRSRCSAALRRSQPHPG